MHRLMVFEKKVNRLFYELSLKKECRQFTVMPKAEFYGQKKRSLINRLFCIHLFCVAENSEYFLIVSCLLVHLKKTKKTDKCNMV
jgi:hypothetical protein